MKLFKLKDFKKGWIAGDFEPAIFRQKDFEVAVQRYKAGQVDSRHKHMKADELTIVVEGVFKANGAILRKDDIILLEKGEVSEFECIEEGSFVAIKVPSVVGDKHLV